MRLSTALERYLTANQTRLSPKARKGYGGDIRRFIAYVIGNTKPSGEGIQHFNRTMVQAYFNHCDDRNLSRNTLNRYQTALRELAKWGLDERLWREDPMRGVASIPKPKTEPRPFSNPERDALMALPLNPTQTALRALIYYTGIRVGTFELIRCCDVKPPAPVALSDGSTVELARIRILTKGSVEQTHYVHPDAWKAVNDLLPHRFSINDPHMRGPLFPILRGARQGGWKDQTIRNIVRKWGERAGVADCTPHRFRHTFATNLVDAGVDIRVVQLMLGHASIQSTMVYTKVSDHRRAAAIGKLPSFQPKTIDANYPPPTPGADALLDDVDGKVPKEQDESGGTCGVN